jgi:hypothetical protein
MAEKDKSALFADWHKLREEELAATGPELAVQIQRELEVLHSLSELDVFIIPGEFFSVAKMIEWRAQAVNE